MTAAAAISTSGLVKKYGSRRALDGFTLSVPRGAILGLVGPNGAGKTTWMMASAGLLRVDAGEIDLMGEGPFDARIHGGRLAILPQDSELPLEACPRDLLYRFGRLQGLRPNDARKSAADALRSVNLSERADSSIRSLSHGMRKRVMLAQCFVGNPEVVLLDEPLNGLDPAECARMRRFIAACRGRRTVVVSSHHLHDIEVICTHAAFVESGRVTSVSALGSLMQASSRLVYALSARPPDEAALAAAVPGASFSWSDADCALTCVFSSSAGGVATVNRLLLPALLAQVDVLSVTRGQSLEQAYLGACAREGAVPEPAP
jgi:ABC-type multidrug transport system ATPase subunit